MTEHPPPAAGAAAAAARGGRQGIGMTAPHDHAHSDQCWWSGFLFGVLAGGLVAWVISAC